MVRISDCRMSGTAFGTVVLHIAPGGRRRAARWRWRETGDRIRLSVKERRLDLLVEEAELATPPRRLDAAAGAARAAGTGWCTSR